MTTRRSMRIVDFMPFVKLDCLMIRSTIWFDMEARNVFITALLMAEPAEFTTPTPQIEIGSMEYTGFVVPPGWYGFVAASGAGLVHTSQVPQADGMAALKRLGDTEPESRSKAFDGRRLVRVDGGFIVLNYLKYRERDATSADRSRRWREHKKMNATRVASHATRVIRHQAEAEAQSSEERAKSSLSGQVEPAPPTSPKKTPADPDIQKRAEALVGYFRAQYHAHADPEYRFSDRLPAADTTAAAYLLRHWARDRLVEIIAWTVRDRTCRGKSWQGWSKQIRSVANLKEHIARLDQAQRESTAPAGDDYGFMGEDADAEEAGTDA